MNDLVKQLIVAVLGALFGALVGAVLTMAGFWLMIGRDYVTRSEVSEMIVNEAPYNADRAMILQTMTETKTTNEQLRDAIQNNTEVIVELKTILAIRQDNNP